MNDYQVFSRPHFAGAIWYVGSRNWTFEAVRKVATFNGQIT